MTSKELKRLSRKELLELLIKQQDLLAQIQAELEDAKAQLKKRNIVLNQVGTMAEAALALNDVFEATDKAAKQYLDNIKHISESQTEKSVKVETETRIHCEKIIEEARGKARNIIAQAEAESRKKRKAAEDYLRAATQSAKDLLESISNKVLDAQ